MTFRLSSMLLLPSLLLVASGCERTAGNADDAHSPATQPAAATQPTLPDVDTTALSPGLQERISQVRASLAGEGDTAWRAVELGSLYYAHGFPDASVDCFEYALQLEPEEFKWWYALARAHEALENTGPAVAAYENALSFQSDYLPARIRLAALLLATDPERAQELFTQVIAMEPRSPAAELGLGHCARQAGNLKDAVAHYQAALEAMPTYAPAHAALADVLAEQGKTEQAVQHRQQAGDRDDAVIPAMDPLEGVLLRTGLDREALLNIANFYVEQGGLAEAEELLVDALLVDEQNVDTRHAYGRLLGMQGKFTAATEEFQRVLERDPTHVTSKVDLAYTLLRLEEPQVQRAAALLTEVLDQQPGNLRALEQYGMLMADQGRIADAEQRIDAALATAPDTASAFLRAAQLLAEIGSMQKSLANTQHALELDPEYAPAYHHLGLLRNDAGDDEAARAAWKEALRIQPRYLQPRLALVALAVKYDDYVRVEELLREGVRRTPEDAVLVNAYGWLLATCPDPTVRNPDEAVKWARKANELAQYEDFEFLDTLAAAYAAQGEFEQARRWIAQAIDLARKAGQEAIVDEFMLRQTLYEDEQPYVQQPRPRTNKDAADD